MPVRLLRFLAAQPLPCEVTHATEVLDTRVLVLAGHIKAEFMRTDSDAGREGNEKAIVTEITRLGRLLLSSFPAG